MAEVREPGGLGFKIFAILGIVLLVVVVVAAIQTYDNDSEVATGATGAPAVSAPAASSSPERATEVPLGAVATGGGGMADDGPGLTMPVYVGLVALTMLATAGGIVFRRQGA